MNDANAVARDPHRNEISGDATMNGPTIQAREVHGGVHFHPASTARARPVPPRQLLPVPAHFTNRRSDLDALDELRAHGSRLIVVSGRAGIGKTTLVSKWLRSLAPDFPDGQLYADLRGH